MAASPLSPLFLFLVTLSLLLIVSQSQVPASKQFRYVNQGEFGEYIIEYDASYRPIDVEGFYRFPFRICFYNTTPDSYVLAIRMGSHRVESLMRWVWEANRNHPVRENSTLSFGSDGNLVLSDVDGRVVWHTNTANKGVTGCSLLQNGNLVLHDKRGRFLWQSFDHPSDTLLAGQSLSLNGLNNKLISRTSDMDGRDGRYSLVLEPAGFTMYLNNSGKLIRYGGWDASYGPASSVMFNSTPETDEAYAFDLLLVQELAVPPAARHLHQVRKAGGPGFINLNRPNYNATYSYLKLGSDGNLKTFTYYDKVTNMAWEETFSFFSNYYVSECSLPSKCSSFGLCNRGMCVACPQPQGLLGWDEECRPAKLPGCNGRAKLDYYKVVGVQNFLSLYSEGEGPMKVEECRQKCSKDCKCLGFLYWEKDFKCWLAPVLETLRKDTNSSYVAYIKYAR